MLSFHREPDVVVLETDRPWAFRPGELFRRDRDAFEITRVVRRSWHWFGLQKPRFLIYGAALDSRPTRQSRSVP
jgi:hypothetical protein